MSPEYLRKNIKDLFAVQQAIDVNIIMSVTNKKGIIMAVNKKFCEVSQYEESELVGKSHNVINSGWHNKSFFTEMWKVMHEGKTWHGEIKNKAKDGSYYWVDTVIVPVFDKAGQIQQYLSLRVVITDKKEAEAALTSAVFTVSHQIRHPLVNMQGLVANCSNENASTEEIKQSCDLMKHELDKMDALTRQMAKDLHEYKMRLKFKPD